MEEGWGSKQIIQYVRDCYVLWTKIRQGRKRDWLLGQDCNFRLSEKASLSNICAKILESQKIHIKKTYGCQDVLVNGYTVRCTCVKFWMWDHKVPRNERGLGRGGSSDIQMDKIPIGIKNFKNNSECQKKMDQCLWGLRKIFSI